MTSSATAKVQLSLYEEGQVSHVVPLEVPTLRPYQASGVDRMRELVSGGKRRVVLVLPTGGGKTVVASHVIRSAVDLGRRVLFVAHRIELLNQTAKQLARFGVTDIGIIRGTDKRARAGAPVQVASIDTLRNRKDVGEFDVVFVDECHRALAAGYEKLFTDYPDAVHIGLTATPFRADGQGLGARYEELVICARPSDLVGDGFILQPRCFSAPALPDLTGVKTTGGDFNLGGLEQAMSKATLVGNLVDEWRTKARGKRTVVFAVSISHSKMIVEEFRNEGIRAVHLDGETSDDERLHILMRLEKGEIDVVSNCGVLCEGWDQPAVKCAVLARPTKSLGLFLQQAGRILRPWTDPDTGEIVTPILLDHAGNCLRHGLPTWDREYGLDGTSRAKKEAGPSLWICPQCFAIGDARGDSCPQCGFVKPKEGGAEKARAVETDATVKLVEVDPTKVFTKADEERAFFLKHTKLAMETGLKPGAVSYRFKEKYGKWPPWSWSQNLKKMYEGNAEWQQMCADRAQVRERWQNRHLEEEQRLQQLQAQVDKEIRNERPETPQTYYTQSSEYIEEPEENWWERDE